MVFGFFARAPPQPPAPPNAASTAVHQLRTPSPSTTSAAPQPPDSPEPQLHPDQLLPLLASVPAKTLHTYTLTRLLPDDASPPSPSILAALCAFYADLTPPPRLHCVRCHKDFYDVENDDHQCVVQHDDDSAEVERLGHGGGYQTLWGCCGRTVEGDGDMGPPDGWCYEGKHTTDHKRARYRADSTVQEDRLVPCLRLNCHGERDALREKHGRSAKSKVGHADDDDEGSEGERDSGMEEMARAASVSTSSVKGKGKAKSNGAKPRSRARKSQGKVKVEQGEDDAKMNVDEGGQEGSKARPVRPKPKSTVADKEKTSTVRGAKSVAHKTSVTAMFAGVELDEKPTKKRKLR